MRPSPLAEQLVALLVAFEDALIRDGLHGVILQVDPRVDSLWRWLGRRERNALPAELVVDEHIVGRDAALEVAI